jgi:DUF4097 and DUF4098 domain-containing protein YvlB
MKTVKYLSLAGLILLLVGCMFGGFINAEDKVEKTFETTGTPTVILETFNGSITVQGNSTNSVDVQITRRGSGSSDADARADLDKVLVKTQQDGNTIRIKIERSDNHSGNTGASVDIRLPKNANLDLNTSNGSISIEAVQGDVRLSSSNGNLEIHGGQGAFNLNTSNGRIEVSAENCVVNANTSNGNISFNGSLANGSSIFNTSNAGVDLTLPSDSVFRISATTSNAGVSSDFAVSGGSQGESYLDGATGDGAQIQINIATSNGSIQIKKH